MSKPHISQIRYESSNGNAQNLYDILEQAKLRIEEYFGSRGDEHKLIGLCVGYAITTSESTTGAAAPGASQPEPIFWAALPPHPPAETNFAQFFAPRSSALKNSGETALSSPEPSDGNTHDDPDFRTFLSQQRELLQTEIASQLSPSLGSNQTITPFIVADSARVNSETTMIRVSSVSCDRSCMGGKKVKPLSRGVCFVSNEDCPHQDVHPPLDA